MSSLDQNSPLFDLSYLEEISYGNNAFVEKMKSVFVSMVDENLPILEHHLKNESIEGVKKVVHQFKPSLKHLKVFTALELIQKIENTSWESKNFDELIELVKHLSQILYNVATALTNNHNKVT